MKKYLVVLLSYLVAFIAPSTMRAESKETLRFAKEFAALSTDQVLDRVRSGPWLKLPALSEVTTDERQSIKSIAEVVLQALAQEARAMPNLTDVIILNRTLRVAAISQIASTNGGYLNDLIAASADQVFLLGAWTLLDKAPALASKLLPVLEARGKLSSAKTWLMERYTIDPDLVAKKELLDALKPDASGFQAVTQLQKEGRDVNDLPTIFNQLETPEIALLWWTVYTLDYRMVVLQAGIATVERGGKLTENTNEFRATCASIFGKDGLPFKHELKRGRVYPEDVLDSWNAAKNASVREIQDAQWFGMP